jgi:hypothetical protein
LLRNSVIQKKKNTVDSKKDDYDKLHTLLHIRITQELSSCNAAVRIWRGDKMWLQYQGILSYARKVHTETIK